MPLADNYYLEISPGSVALGVAVAQEFSVYHYSGRGAFISTVDTSTAGSAVGSGSISLPAGTEGGWYTFNPITGGYMGDTLIDVTDLVKGYRSRDVPFLHFRVSSQSPGAVGLRPPVLISTGLVDNAETTCVGVDDTPPVLQSIDVEPKVVQAYQPTTVNYTVTDESALIRFEIMFEFDPPGPGSWGGGASDIDLDGEISLTGGNRDEFVHEWSFSYALLIDEIGNFIYYFPDGTSRVGRWDLERDVEISGSASTHNFDFSDVYYFMMPIGFPAANAGPDQTDVASAASVTLDGSGSSDPDAGDTLTYAWTQTAGPTVTLSSVTAEQPTFTAPTLGANDSAVTLTFSLVVTDDKSNASEADTVSITVNPPANTAPTANAGPDQTDVASAASVTLDGSGSSDPDAGDTLTYAWTQTAGPTVTLSSATAEQPTFTAPTLGANDSAVTLTFSLVVTDDKSNASTADTVSITVNPPDPTPASEFAENEVEIRQIITDTAQRSLNATLGVNRRMNEEALERFIDARRSQDGDDTGFVSRNDVPLDVDGVLRIDGTTFSTRGDFFAQQGSMDGSSRRLFFGDFDLQRDGDSGSTTATVTARLAWERMLSDTTMLGYFVGGELAFSDIEGAFTGDQDRIGATVGLYAVHALDEQLFLDGFVTLGAGRNDLDMASDVLDLDSTYTTRTATIGGALSGVYEYGHYEFRPELAFSYGKTWIGNVGFTGRAYGLVDDTLSLDAGDVSMANLTLRPEVIWALDADTVAESRSQLSFSPRLVCEQTIASNQTQNCGGGAEVGLSSMSDDGMSNIEFRVLADRVGSSTRSSFAINLEHRF